MKDIMFWSALRIQQFPLCLWMGGCCLFLSFSHESLGIVLEPCFADSSLVLHSWSSYNVSITIYTLFSRFCSLHFASIHICLSRFFLIHPDCHFVWHNSIPLQPCTTACSSCLFKKNFFLILTFCLRINTM